MPLCFCASLGIPEVGELATLAFRRDCGDHISTVYIDILCLHDFQRAAGIGGTSSQQLQSLRAVHVLLWGISNNFTQFSCSLQMLDTIAIICHWSFCWLRCSFSSSKSSTLRSFSTRFQYDEHDEIDSKKNEPLTVANKSLAPTMARSILVTFRIITVHLFAGGSCCKGREETPQESTSRGQPRNSGRPGFGIDGGLMGHDGTGIIAGYSRVVDLRSAVSIYINL